MCEVETSVTNLALDWGRGSCVENKGFVTDVDSREDSDDLVWF